MKKKSERSLAKFVSLGLGALATALCSLALLKRKKQATAPDTKDSKANLLEQKIFAAIDELADDLAHWQPSFALSQFCVKIQDLQNSELYVEDHALNEYVFDRAADIQGLLELLNKASYKCDIYPREEQGITHFSVVMEENHLPLVLNSHDPQEVISKLGELFQSAQNPKYSPYLLAAQLELALSDLVDIRNLPVQESYLAYQKRARKGLDLKFFSPFVEEENSYFKDCEDSDFGIRRSLAAEIMRKQPLHLSCDFKLNYQDGNLGIELVMLDHKALQELPEDLSIATKNPRIAKAAIARSKKLMAARYSLALGLSLVRSAFLASEQLKHVWLLMKGPQGRDYRLIVDFDSYHWFKLASQISLEKASLYSFLHSFAANFRLSDEGYFLPVEKTASLTDERFCPKRRLEHVALSSRQLSPEAAHVLSAKSVSEFNIDESTARSYVAAQLLDRWIFDNDPKATERNVKSLLHLSAESSDLSVSEASQRLIHTMLFDDFAPQNPEELALSFIKGDALSQAVNEAKEALNEQNPALALEILTEEIERADAAGSYVDSKSVEWRFFSSYTERALYNHLNAIQDKPETLLAPVSYYEALILASTAAGICQDFELAETFAERVYTLAPMDVVASLQLVACLRYQGEQKRAIDILKEQLKRSFERMSFVFIYYQLGLAYLELNNIEASAASFARVLALQPEMPVAYLSPIMQVAALLEADFELGFREMTEMPLHVDLFDINRQPYQSELSKSQLLDVIALMIDANNGMPPTEDVKASLSEGQLELLQGAIAVMPTISLNEQASEKYLSGEGISTDLDQETADYLYEALKASINDEVFPLALSISRNYLTISNDPEMKILTQSLSYPQLMN